MSDGRWFQIEVPGSCPQEIVDRIDGGLAGVWDTVLVPGSKMSTWTFAAHDINYGAYGWRENYGGEDILSDLQAAGVGYDLTTGPGDHDGYQISWRPGWKQERELTTTTDGELVLTERDLHLIILQSLTPSEIATKVMAWFHIPPLVDVKLDRMTNVGS